MRLILAMALLPGIAAAEPMTAERFDEATLGKTMTWSEFGQAYGVEQYLPNRRVRWTFTGDDCMTGHWYPDGNAICFQYEDRDTPACWIIGQNGGNLTALDTEDPPDTPPVIVAETVEPMACFGPEVGV